MIELTRFVKDDATTLGRFSYATRTFFTVERPWLDNQPNVSCIPDGDYKMARVDSPKFGPGMWEIVNVLGRTHILLHVANTPRNVEGCLGVGLSVYPDLKGVGSSRNGIDEFYLLTSGLAEETIRIKTGHVSG